MMAQHHEIEEMQEEELLDFIRDTVGQLNALGDKLERYAAAKEEGDRGNDG